VHAEQRKHKGLLGFKTLRPYLRLLRGQELDLLLALALMLVATAVGLSIPLIAGRYIDTLGAELPAGLGRQQLLALAGLLVVQLVGTFFYTIVSARLGLRTVTRLRRELFAHLLELPALFFTGQKAGDLSTRVTSDVGSIQYLLTQGAVGMCRALLTLLGALILMVRMNPRLTIMVVLLIPSTILLVRLFGTRLQKLSRRMYDELGKVSSQVQESVGGIRSLKVYNAQNHENRRFGQMVDSYLMAGIRRAWVSAALESGIQISLWICMISIVIYGFALAARGETTSGNLVAFLLLAFRVAMPLASLTNLFASAQGAIAAAGRLDDVFSLEPERVPGATVPKPDSRPANIVLDGVGFSYPESQDVQPVLTDISAEIPAGSWVGIVGPSGAGKTTLAGLLMGLFKPTTGRLLLDGDDYTSLELSRLRSRMAFVAQDPMLYDQSFAENIRFGLGEVGDESVRQAAAKAGVLEFADRLPDGLDSTCGERGARLSGGQKQRVALARAFLRDPGLLVLDEPTSALDAAAEEGIRSALQELMTGRTAIVIAHRFSLVRDLDLILVLNDGKLVEIGNHSQLMDRQGLYYSLYQLQQGQRPTNDGDLG